MDLLLITAVIINAGVLLNHWIRIRRLGGEMNDVTRTLANVVRRLG